MATLARTNTKTARDENLAKTIADVVSLELSVVEARLAEVHGRTRLDTAFAEQWPTTAAHFEGKSAAWARDHGLDEELAVITGLTARTVRGRLKKAAGRMHVQNVFSADWPEEDPALAKLGKKLGNTAGSSKEEQPWPTRDAQGCQIAGPPPSSKQRTTGVKTTTEKTAAKMTSKTRTKTTRKTNQAKGSTSTGALGFESKLWDAADLLRNNMDPSEYKHVVLGLLFLKYIADAFEERRAALRASVDDPKSDDFCDPATKDAAQREAWLKVLLEDRDEYTAENVFWVPQEARWTRLQARAKQPTIGKDIDDAMDAIEKDNIRLKGVLPKIYGLPNLDKHNLGELIDLVSGIGLGTKEHRDKDTLGRTYEYFLSKFASAEGKGGGEFYTPSSVVALLVEMLEPYKGRVYDPCCGSGGMFVQSLKFIEAHDGKRNQITVYGQESNRTTWRMAQMNLAIRGIETNLGKKHADTFHEDLHPDLRADFILANPPFNISKWGGERLENDVRWQYGTPPSRNANYGWIQHFVHHLAPTGTAGFVLANGSMSSMQSGEGEIRKRLVQADLVDCIVACPGQLFYATQIPVCLWFVTKSKNAKGHRNRRGETLFIDARKMGRMENRVHRVFDAEHVARVADTYHAWRNAVSQESGEYADVAGFCKSATTTEIGTHDFVLTPGRYVGVAEVEDDGEPFEEKMARLTTKLWAQMEEGADLDRAIQGSLDGLMHGH